MGTVLQYNNVFLHNVLIREFRQEVVYDPSHTNRLRSRYTITVEGVVSKRYVESSFLNDSQSVKLLKAIQLALAEPRRNLYITQYSWGKPDEAEMLFRCVASDYDPEDPERDLANGPKPVDLRVVSVLGTQTYQIQWTVQCEKLESPRGNELQFLNSYQGPQPVLSNRWSVSEEFDENCFCTRTISGSLHMSQPAAQTGFDYRWLAVPGLEAGFKRQRMRYAVQPDGLEVQYEIQDRQVHTMPPWPCTDMRIRHIRSTNYGVTAIAQCEVQLAGPPDVPKTALIARLVQIMDYYLGILRNAKNYSKTWQIRQATIVEEIGATNQVSGQIEIQILGDPQESGATSNEFIQRHMLALGRDLDLKEYETPHAPGRQQPTETYHPCVAETPSPFGYNTWGGERNPAVIALFQCYLQQPYRPPHGMANWPAPQPVKQEEEKHAKPQVERVPVEALKPVEKSDKYSPAHKQNLYTYVRMKNSYRIHRLLAGCPQAVGVQTPGVQTAGPTTTILPLGRGAASRTVHYDAERLGDWPELPKPEDFTFGGSDQQAVQAKLQKYVVKPLPTTVSPTGDGLIYRVQAVYRWLLDRLPPADQPWPLGRLPHVDDQDRKPFLLDTVSQARIGPTDEGKPA
jgi:hypothetical protein